MVKKPHLHIEFYLNIIICIAFIHIVSIRTCLAMKIAKINFIYIKHKKHVSLFKEILKLKRMVNYRSYFHTFQSLILFLPKHLF